MSHLPEMLVDRYRRFKYRHFVPNQEQEPGVTQALAWIFGPGSGAFLILGSLIFLAMPAVEARRAQVHRILARRAARR